MPSSGQTFRQMWHAGVRVGTRTALQRNGIIRAVQGTGPRANILVSFSASPPVVMHPPQLIIL